jgi:hypothetical protein
MRSGTKRPKGKSGIAWLNLENQLCELYPTYRAASPMALL